LKNLIRNLVFIALSVVNAASRSDGQEQVSAALTAEPGLLPLHGRFSLTLSVTSVNTRLAKQIEVRSLPSERHFKLEPFRELPVRRRMVNGQIEEVRRFRARATAMETGAFSIGPVLQVAVLKRKPLFIGSTWVEEPLRVPVPPVAVKVHPLPRDGRPPDFSGAVGRFRLLVDVAPTNVAAGDLVVLQSTIEGSGYLEDATPPQAENSRLFRAYPPEPLEINDGKAAYRQIVVPLSTNARAIPALRFSFYDPKAARYVTATQGPFRLQFHELPDVSPVAVPEGSPPDAAADFSAADGGAAAARAAAPRPLSIAIAVTLVLALLAAVAVVVFARGRRLRFMLAVVVILPLLTVTVWRLRSPDGESSRYSMTSQQPARIAPAPTALPLFTIPRGARVRIVGKWRHWLKVEYGEDRGWIPQTAVSTDRAPR